MKKIIFVLLSLFVASVAFAETKWAVWFIDSSDFLDPGAKYALCVADSMTMENGFVKLEGNIKYLKKVSSVDLRKAFTENAKLAVKAKNLGSGTLYISTTRIYTMKPFDPNEVLVKEMANENNAAKELAKAEKAEKAEKAAAAKAAKAEQDAAEKAMKAEKAAAEKKAKEDKAAAEKAVKDAAEKEIADKAAAEKKAKDLEKAVAEKAKKDAAEKAKKDAAEKAKKEAAEKAAAKEAKAKK